MDMREYLSREALAIKESSLSSLPDVKDWPAEQARRRRAFYDMMGITHWMEEERSPLNVKVTGELERPGYRVQNVHFESLPQLYVTGNLYIPEPLDRPVPGILYVCGHQHPQKTVYQAHARRFAQLGCVCLIVETIQRGEIEGYHHGPINCGWYHSYSRGYTPGGVELWNGIRGLDLLESLDAVDNERLGVTGMSGGGALTWWITAADPRVAAGASVCGTYTFESWVSDGLVDTNCDCMMPINYDRWEMADVGALIAPRPFLIVSNKHDLCFTVESAHDVYSKLRGLYDHLGAEDSLKWLSPEGPHGYHPESCRAVFGLFMRRFMGDTRPDEEMPSVDERPEVQESQETLDVFVDGIPADERTTAIQEDFVPLAPEPTITTSVELKDHRDKVIAFLREKSFGHFPEKPCPHDLTVTHEFQASHGPGGPYGDGGSFRFQSKEDVWLDGGWWIPPEAPTSLPVVVILRSPDERPKSLWDTSSTWFGIHQRSPKWTQVHVEARGTGSKAWGPSVQWNLRRAALLTGRTIASVQVYDVLRAVEAIADLPAIQGRRLVLAGRGQMAAVALYAALLSDEVNGVILEDAPATQNAPSQPDGSGQALEMLGCLRVTDLPQVAGMLWPREIVFIGRRPESYAWAEELYRRLGAPGAVRRISRLQKWFPNVPDGRV